MVKKNSIGHTTTKEIGVSNGLVLPVLCLNKNFVRGLK